MIIDLEERRKSRELRKQSLNSPKPEEVEKCCVLLDEAKQIVNQLTVPFILKLMSECRLRLVTLDGGKK